MNPIKLVKRGTAPCRACGFWRCIHCGSVYEVDRETSTSDYNWRDNQLDGESLEANCEVCQMKRYLSRTVSPAANVYRGPTR